MIMVQTDVLGILQTVAMRGINHTNNRAIKHYRSHIRDLGHLFAS